MMNSKIGWSVLILSFLIFLNGVSGCGRDEEKASANSSPTPAVEEKTVDDFGESLKTVQRGNFNFIFAFRRADGEVFSSDDKTYLKANSPLNTNQWILTADGKTAIAGSNYKFTSENLNALKKRFTVDDYSDAAQDGGQNSNSQNANDAK